MTTWLAVLIGSILVSTSLLILASVVHRAAEHFDGVANLFFAVRTMQLRLELDECGYEVPSWLCIMDDDPEPMDMPPPTDLRLVKLAKDKVEE